MNNTQLSFHPDAHAGFTLTELVVIIIVLGIIAAIAIPRFADTDTFESRVAADQVAAALRYAQKYAIASHATTTVTISSGASSDCAASVVAGAVACVISNSVSISHALPWTVTFDAMGQPPAAISVTVGSTFITVEAVTGYVH